MNFEITPKEVEKGRRHHRTLEIYCDSDWAGCRETRRSTSGFLIKLDDAPVIHFSRTQSTIALSSVEAELYAMSAGAIDGLSIVTVMSETNPEVKVELKIFTDSSAGRSMATRKGLGKKAKAYTDSTVAFARCG